MPVITSKELGTIQDQLNLERNLVNKYTEYAESTNDTVLKQKYQQIAAKHESHYESLFLLSYEIREERKMVQPSFSDKTD